MRRPAFALAFGLLAASAAGAEPARQVPPLKKVASLNLCADELVLRLAAPGQVASVTFLARDKSASNVADLAESVPVNRGLAEEVVPLSPDLVIAGAYTTRSTTQMLRRLGVEVLELDTPRSVEEAYGQIRAVAARLGAQAKGEAMIAQMEKEFAALSPSPTPRTAIVLRPNGFTAGAGSLVDDILRRAGLDNLAARMSTDSFGQLALEQIVRARPDLLVVNEEDTPSSLGAELLQHPALAAYPRTHRTAAVPPRLWTCAGPDLPQAARLLIDATRDHDARAGQTSADAARHLPAGPSSGEDLTP